MQVEYFRMYDLGIFAKMSNSTEESFYKSYSPILLQQVKDRIRDFSDYDTDTLFG